MTSTHLEALKQDLPNFPEEVLTDWLEPFARTNGWPPVLDSCQLPQGRWKYILIGRPLGYWQSLRWEKVERHLSVQDLSTREQEKIVKMALAAVAGQVNIYSDSIPDLKQRFFNVVSYLVEHGTLPKAPSLIQDPDGIQIMDGNHRIAAYLYCYGYFRLELDPNTQLATKAQQQFWVAHA